MKKQIYFLLFAIIALVCYTIFRNAKTHVEAVEVVEELVVKADSLNIKVNTLHKEKDSVITEMEVLDSTIDSKDKLIYKQNAALSILKRDTAALKKVGPIIIRDTVYITETKNFWGKKKKSIESSSSTIDTLEIDFSEDSLETK